MNDHNIIIDDGTRASLVSPHVRHPLTSIIADISHFNDSASSIINSRSGAADAVDNDHDIDHNNNNNNNNNNDNDHNNNEEDLFIAQYLANLDVMSSETITPGATGIGINNDSFLIDHHLHHHHHQHHHAGTSTGGGVNDDDDDDGEFHGNNDPRSNVAQAGVVPTTEVLQHNNSGAVNDQILFALVHQQQQMQLQMQIMQQQVQQQQQTLQEIKSTVDRLLLLTTMRTQSAVDNNQSSSMFGVPSTPAFNQVNYGNSSVLSDSDSDSKTAMDNSCSNSIGGMSANVGVGVVPSKYYCAEHDKYFSSSSNYHRHMREVHGKKKRQSQATTIDKKRRPSSSSNGSADMADDVTNSFYCSSD